jgi:hypothetical protein
MVMRRKVEMKRRAVGVPMRTTVVGEDERPPPPPTGR